MSQQLSDLAEEFQNFLEFKKQVGQPTLENIWATVKKLSLQMDILVNKPNTITKKKKDLSNLKYDVKTGDLHVPEGRFERAIERSSVPVNVPKLKEPYPSRVIKLGPGAKRKSKYSVSNLTPEMLFRVDIYKALKFTDIPLEEDKFRDLMNMLIEETLKTYDCAKVTVMHAYSSYAMGYANSTGFYNWLKKYECGQLPTQKIRALKDFLKRGILENATTDKTKI